MERNDKSTKTLYYFVFVSYTTEANPPAWRSSDWTMPRLNRTVTPWAQKSQETQIDDDGINYLRNQSRTGFEAFDDRLTEPAMRWWTINDILHSANVEYEHITDVLGAIQDSCYGRKTMVLGQIETDVSKSGWVMLFLFSLHAMWHMFLEIYF